MKISELEMMNAFIGFCRMSGPAWPHPLAVSGVEYDAVGIERKIPALVDGRTTRVLPDVVCASVPLQHAFCLEAKSATLGKSGVSQARAYEQVTIKSLQDFGGLPPTVKANQVTHDILYATSDESFPSLETQLNDAGVKFPVVAVDETCFALVRGRLTQETLNQIFSDGIDIRGHEWPSHYVHFTSRSPGHVIAPYVFAHVHRFIRKNRSFSLEQLMKDAVDHWNLCDDAERRALRAMVGNLLHAAAREELNLYLSRQEGKSPNWTVAAHRSKVRREHTVQRDIAIQRRIRTFCYRLEHNIRYQPGQELLDLPGDPVDPDEE